MRKTIITVLFATAFAALSLTPTAAQMDALVVAFNRCADPTRPVESRIQECTVVIGAKGIDPDEVAFAWLDLGLAYQSQGSDRQRELDAYNKALELQPDLWQAHANRARLYIEAGDGDKALLDYQAMRLSGPDKVQLYRSKSSLEYRTTRIEGTASDRPDMDVKGREQAEYSNSLDRIGRALQTGFSNLCKRRALAGLELDAALRDCDAVLQMNASDEMAHYGRGIVDFRRADWPAALGEFNTVLSNHPNAAESLYMKGIVERRMQNNSAGDTDIAAARTIDGNVANTHAQFGILP